MENKIHLFFIKLFNLLFIDLKTKGKYKLFKSTPIYLFFKKQEYINNLSYIFVF